MRTPLAAAMLIAAAAVAAPELKDAPGVKDPALFTRLPNYYLLRNLDVAEKQFEAYKFRVPKGNTWEAQAVEGHYTHYRYTFDKNAGAPASPLQIIRNYQAATARIGGKMLYENPRVTTLKIVGKDGSEVWVSVDTEPFGAVYHLHIVERQAMKQDVTANAQVFDAGLKASGHVEVPGILFDFGKADVKPESEPALKEVVKLMQADPVLKVWVVGHTDNVGTADANVTLSNARAASVVKSLTAMGVNASRLAPHGAGPYAPVASNGTEEGRAKNRRVELVSR